MTAPAPGARIAVLGEALVDVFADAEVIGGAPFNVARNLAALGEAPLFVSRIGRDAAGERIAGELRQLGMDPRGLQRDAGHATGRVLVREVAGQPHFAIGEDAAWDHLVAADALQAVDAFAPGLLYFGTLAQRSPATREAIRAVLTRSTARRVLDLNLRGIADECEIAAESLALADIVKVNDGELARLVDWFTTSRDGGESPSPATMADLMQRFGLERLVLTRGADGWACYGPDGGMLLSGRAPPVAVRDTVGAGDAFSAVMLAGEARAWPLATTLRRAADFAAQACTLRGAFNPASPIYAAARSAWQAETADARTVD